MRRILMVAGLAAATLATVAGARTLDPAKPEDALEVMKRTQCGAKDGEPAVYHWSGKIYSRVEGERDRLLFLSEGMNIRKCVAVTDPQRGKGFRQVSREVMLFLDPATGEVLRQWTNPWTNERVEVMHIANDPVNGRPTFATGADGKPYQLSYKRMGDWVQMPLEVPLFYHNVLAGDYEDYVGNQYHAMEIFDFAARADELLDTAKPTAYPSVSWVRISNWMPWMKMGSRQGLIVFNAMGAKVRKFDDLPAVLRQEIATNYPAYTAPPAADDARPNATTWTVFKAKVDADRAAKGAAQPPR